MTAVPVEDLLAETRWLEELARRLVGDRHAAADLVQETLTTALARPPAGDRPLRGWLRTVLVSRLLDGGRAARARAGRERAAADREAASPSTLDVVVKAEAQQHLVAAVLALDEPYRSTVLLRYWEGLAPREIARRVGAPVATVHSRTQRAMTQLRARLEGAHGPRWSLALLPLWQQPRPVLPVLLGASLMNTLAKLAAVAVVITTAAVLWPRDAAPPAPSDRGAAQAASQVASAAAAQQGVSETLSREALSREALPSPVASEPPAGGAPRVVHGRVLDVHGRGVAGVRLAAGAAADAASPLATSDANGRFSCEPGDDTDALVTQDRRWATVLAGAVPLSADTACVVVVAPRLRLRGAVHDGEGRPLAGAAVTVHMPAHLGAELGILLDHTVPRSWRAVSDELGGYELLDVPAVGGARVAATLGGYLPRFEAMPAGDARMLDFVLERPGEAVRTVEGIVVDVWGSAVAGARVGAGAAVSITDASGAFTVDVSDGRRLPRLVAAARGAQPAVFAPELSADGAPRWPARVVMQLGPPPLSLQGRVVDGDGAPVAGARVWVADPTLIGNEGDCVLAETLLGREDRPFWAFVRSDQGGAFRIDGLAARPYVVRAVDPRNLAAVTVPGVAAGATGVELRLEDELFESLRGRVVTRDGEPLAGVSVHLQRPALEVRVPGGTRDEWVPGADVTTDTDGAFAFAQVPMRDVEVFAHGDAILFAHRIVTPDVDPLDFDVTADRRVHLQVELVPPVDRADEVVVLDSRGKRMLLRVMRGQSSYTNRRAELRDGRTQVLSLGEGAVEIVLLRGDEEVGRMPVQLAFPGTNVIRF